MLNLVIHPILFVFLIVDMNDPSYVVASQHFRQLLIRYGAPGYYFCSIG